MARLQIENLRHVTYVESSGRSMFSMVKQQSNIMMKFLVMVKRNALVQVAALKIIE